MADLTIEAASELVQDDILYWLANPFMDPAARADKVCFWLDSAINARLGLLTSDEALAAFREAWHYADAAGADGDRVRQGMVAAIKAVSS